MKTFFATQCSSVFSEYCRQTVVVVVPCKADEPTHWYRQCRRRDKLDVDVAATDQCRHDGSDVDKVAGGPHHPRCTDADTPDTAVLASAADYR